MLLRFVRVICQIVHWEMIFILLHCTMLIWVHLDAWIIIARVLYDVNCCLLTELAVCLFRCILCVHPMSLISTWVLSYIMPYLQWCNPCIFLSLVLSASSSWSRVLVVSVLLDWICYNMMLCKPAATSHCMHNLEMFTKDILLYMSCSIHPCPWLHL